MGCYHLDKLPGFSAWVLSNRDKLTADEIDALRTSTICTDRGWVPNAPDVTKALDAMLEHMRQPRPPKPEHATLHLVTAKEERHRRPDAKCKLCGERVEWMTTATKAVSTPEEYAALARQRGYRPCGGWTEEMQAQADAAGEPDPDPFADP